MRFYGHFSIVIALFRFFQKPTKILQNLFKLQMWLYLFLKWQYWKYWGTESWITCSLFDLGEFLSIFSLLPLGEDKLKLVNRLLNEYYFIFIPSYETLRNIWFYVFKVLRCWSWNIKSCFDWFVEPSTISFGLKICD